MENEEAEKEEYHQKKRDSLITIMHSLKENPPKKDIRNGFNRLAGEMLIELMPEQYGSWPAGEMYEIRAILGYMMFAVYVMGSIDSEDVRQGDEDAY